MKAIKVLIKNESAAYSSESVMYGDQKFKIVAENGNSYSRLNVYTYTSQGELCLVACKGDIPEYKDVSYVLADQQRLLRNRVNIIAAENYIKKVF